MYWHFIDIAFSDDGTPTHAGGVPNALTEMSCCAMRWRRRDARRHQVLRPGLADSPGRRRASASPRCRALPHNNADGDNGGNDVKLHCAPDVVLRRQPARANGTASSATRTTWRRHARARPRRAPCAAGRRRSPIPRPGRREHADFAKRRVPGSGRRAPSVIPEPASVRPTFRTRESFAKSRVILAATDSPPSSTPRLNH